MKTKGMTDAQYGILHGILFVTSYAILLTAIVN